MAPPQATSHRSKPKPPDRTQATPRGASPRGHPQLVSIWRQPCGRRPPLTTDFDYLLHPGTKFEHPSDAVSHSGLTLADKRATLASWASDASAIASCPSLRAPEGLKAPVTIDEILEALCALDGGPRHPPGGKPMRLQSTERRAAA